jgi:PTH1 family peptidyl-tRNA hydrolase
MKYLIAGLGNPDTEYLNTRHNVGFLMADALAASCGAAFSDARHAWRAQAKYRGRTAIVIKPTTFMNLSGKAVQYWLREERVPVERLMVLTDDIALPFGAIRLRARGSDGGHNGLSDIIETLGTSVFPRLRFGVGNDFLRGRQADYVLSDWTAEEQRELPARIEACVEAVKTYLHAGLTEAMNRFNNR